MISEITQQTLETLEKCVKHGGIPSSRYCQHSAYHSQKSSQKAIQDLHFDRAGAAGGGDIRKVQLAGHCKHAVGVYDDGDKAGIGEG